MSGPELRWELRRPPGWLPVSDDPRADLAGVAVPDSARPRLERELELVRSRTQLDGAPGRRHWAFVPDVGTGAVPATMSSEVARRGVGSMQELADRLSSAPPPIGTRLWHRDVVLTPRAGGPLVSALELLEATSDDGEQRIVERYRGILATPLPGIVLRLDISTYDLALFADIVAYGDEVMDAVTFPRAGRAA